MKLLLLVLGLAVAREYPPESKAPKKPKLMSGELYCNACQGIVRELEKKLRKKTLESDVIEAMEEICDMWKYAAYEFPPPEFKKGCEAFVAEYDELIENAMEQRFTMETDVETYVCHEQTKACVDISLDFIPKTDDSILIDNKKVPMKDGKVNLQEAMKDDEL
jgi:hypothetical protein